MRICRVKDAKRYLEKFKRVDIAIDSFYSDPGMFSSSAATSKRPDAAPSTSKLSALFDKYKGTVVP